MKQMLILFFAVITSTCSAAQNPPAQTQTSIILAPQENNPRNSEGDFVRLKDGRILFVFSQYTGKSVSDHAPANLAAITSSDNGKTWSEPKVIISRPKGSLNVMSLSMLRLQDGRIALFYLDKHTLGDCRPCVRFSQDEGENWSPAQHCITDEVGYYVTNNSRVIQLSSGTVIIPVAYHNKKGEKFKPNAKMFCYISTDQCKTWVRSGEAVNPGSAIFQEPGVVEMADGRVLMYIRANDGCQHLSWSRDGGKTWSVAEKSAFISPLSPMSIRAIPHSDQFIAVWNENLKQRDPLTIAVLNQKLDFISKFTLDTSGPDLARWFCYPAIFPLGNGQYLISYCAGAKKNWGLDTTKIIITKPKTRDNYNE